MPAKQHKVVKEFRDQSGRTWRAGEVFTGDEKAIQAAKQAGQIQESTDPSQSDQPPSE